jgi:ribosomal protein L37E
MLTPELREEIRRWVKEAWYRPALSRAAHADFLTILADLEAALEENTALSQCPRCGEPDDALFNKQTDKQGPFCASCGWPERLDLTGVRGAVMEKLPDLEAIKVDLKSSQMPGNVAAAARLLDAIPGLIAYAEWLREMLIREHGPETYPACYRALPLGYRCEAHEGDVADGRCVCCEVAQVARLTAENTALKELLHTALDHPAIPTNLGKAWCAETRALLAAETAEPHPHDWH